MGILLECCLGHLPGALQLPAPCHNEVRNGHTRGFVVIKGVESVADSYGGLWWGYTERGQ